jgi:asparagine synthase (glutamine-hydrolysing)
LGIIFWGRGKAPGLNGMCGIAGFFEKSGLQPPDLEVLDRMTNKLVHRGPDSRGQYAEPGLGFGFRRLAIMDLINGMQPMTNEDRTVISMCNGEIYDYPALRRELTSKGHELSTNCDCEIIPHLYEDFGVDMFRRLNGQFALALYDRNKRTLYLARDHFGVCPLYYAFEKDTCIFGSEIKAILQHPLAPRQVDLIGLDQLVTFPGTISPRTMFQGIRSLPGGHYIKVDCSGLSTHEYWDLEYPLITDATAGESEAYHIRCVSEVLVASVSRRLQADVPVGLYLSGGLDSSLIAGLVKRITTDVPRLTLSVSFAGKEMCEGRYQRQATSTIDSIHADIPYDFEGMPRMLRTAIYHAESPLKETHDTASLALSAAAKSRGISVALTGQGADELFAGYVGYRFDKFYSGGMSRPATTAERNLRTALWGDENLAYEHDLVSLWAQKSSLYSDVVNERLSMLDPCALIPINRSRLEGRHILHKRSYLDLKMRLADHLLADHGDRMAMANSVELRHPFLDLDVAGVAAKIPPDLMLKGYTEKYILREAAKPFVPCEIAKREKFGWYTPGSPALLRCGNEYVGHLLSPAAIRRQGYFNPQTVEVLKSKYLQEHFMLNQPFETDVLAIVLTFGMFLDAFGLPDM